MSESQLFLIDGCRVWNTSRRVSINTSSSIDTISRCTSAWRFLWTTGDLSKILEQVEPTWKAFRADVALQLILFVNWIMNLLTTTCGVSIPRRAPSSDKIGSLGKPTLCRIDGLHCTGIISYTSYSGWWQKRERRWRMCQDVIESRQSYINWCFTIGLKEGIFPSRSKMEKFVSHKHRERRSWAGVCITNTVYGRHHWESGQKLIWTRLTEAIGTAGAHLQDIWFSSKEIHRGYCHRSRGNIRVDSALAWKKLLTKRRIPTLLLILNSELIIESKPRAKVP